jgi:hypothetical protein
VKGSSFSPDGARILTIDDDGMAWIWEAATGLEIAALWGPSGQRLSNRSVRHGP